MTDTAPPQHLSYSAATLWERCPAAWHHKYIEQLPDPSSQPAARGTAVHTVMEHLLALPAEQRTPRAAQKLCSKVWAETVWPEPPAESLRWEMWRDVEGLMRLIAPKTVTNPRTEMLLECDLGGVPFRGVADLVHDTDDGLVIADYKTGRVPDGHVREVPWRQVRLYAAAFAAVTGDTPARLEVVYSGATGRGAARRDPRVFGEGWNGGAVELAVGWLAERWGEILGALESGVGLGATPNRLCGWCPFLGGCEPGQAKTGAR